MAPTAPARADDFLVTVAHDDGDGVCVPDECTLREALSEAGANDTVFLPPGAYELADGQLVLDGDRLVGGGARTTSILGDGLERVLLVASGANEITGVTITGGDVPSAPPTGTGGGR